VVNWLMFKDIADGRRQRAAALLLVMFNVVTFEDPAMLNQSLRLARLMELLCRIQPEFVAHESVRTLLPHCSVTNNRRIGVDGRNNAQYAVGGLKL